MEDAMESSAVPSRLTWPDLIVPTNLERPANDSPGAIADYLVATLLSRAPGLLQAEFIAEGPIAWFVRAGGRQVEEVFRSSNSATFRSLLARFGGHYLDTQLYGGYVQRVLIFGEQRWMCRIYMSNAGGSGLWIRAYAMHQVNAT
jgi:hypothetical protein